MKEPIIYNSNGSDILFIHSKSDKCNIDIHLHDSYEIFMAMSPNMRYHIEGRAYDLLNGDIIITNEKEIHRPASVGDGPYERSFIQFKPSIFARFFDDEYNPLRIFENRTPGVNNKISFHNKKNNPTIFLFEEIEQLSAKKSAKNQLIIKSLLIKLLTELEGAYKISTTEKMQHSYSDERIERLIQDLNKISTNHSILKKLARIISWTNITCVICLRKTQVSHCLNIYNPNESNKRKCLYLRGKA